MKATLQNIALKNNLILNQVIPLSGGDINEVFLLKCNSGDFVIKQNDAHRFPKMFEAEANGLEALRNSQSFRIPKVFAYEEDGNKTYLLLEYISKGTVSASFWETFAQHLAKLHKTTNTSFGFAHSNYIGSLPQINNYKSNASDFYINQRLEPQFKRARKLGFNFSSLDLIFKNISE